MPNWTYLTLAVASWLALALLIGLVLGAIIKRRDRGGRRNGSPDDEPRG